MKCYYKHMQIDHHVWSAARMNRIIIVGSSGAGKTTLAKAIAEKLAIPHFELDSIFHQKNWEPLGVAEFRNQVDKITEQSNWVICGNYFNKLGGEAFWKKADTVIWCDYSFPLVFSRLLRRTIRRTVTREELWNENREGFVANFFTKDSVLLWMMHAWKKQRRTYGKLFKKNRLGATTLIRLTSPKMTKAFLDDAQLHQK
jgi:adenylate kinase family enzyme